MECDRSIGELLDEYAKNGRTPFHMPGHKRNTERFGHLADLSAAVDITEIEGFDNLHDAEGILARSMERAAELWHSDRSYFLVNGSTCGILAGIRALTHRGDTVLLSRNAHKSIYHAIEICGLRPVFVTPPYDADRGMFLSLPPESVAAALAAHPAVRLVILTSPTYEGVVSDVASIAELAHAYGAALLVDEAHGAHLSLHPAFPRGAVLSGADIVVQSLHKTLPSLTQTAILHTRGVRVDQERLAHQLAVFETSSPSYLLLASMDGCVRTLATDASVLADWAERLSGLDADLHSLSRLYVPRRNPALSGVFDLDPSKIYVCGADGASLGTFLRERGIEPEMITPRGVLLMSGAGDTRAMMAMLAHVLREADGTPLPIAPPACVLPVLQSDTELSPEEALEAEWEWKDTVSACGCIAAEYVWAYPPGIPVLIPGQRIPANFVQIAAQMTLHSTRRSLPAKIAVVR